ncbi:CobW family GTP-binding protein [Bradyrhizobium sp. HKCCYLS1011]|uniref:CobW family GTP-binding protein n=1 Tax=Bradyrhizobium sp. HKCCYLS1011 TaxID=3420733 RepID=UPI003EBC840B
MMAAAPIPNPVPMTVIGGFLGAGKTTFLNRLLAESIERCAVLVNDFGEINVDAALIESHDGTTMSLANGCVCCSTGTGFLDVLARLLDDLDRFDRVVIEASGVGDPWRIAEIALVEPALRLDGVITLVDASRIAMLIDDVRVGDTVRQQLAKCDVVLLSKSDLVDAAQLDISRRAVRTVRADMAIAVLSRDTLPDLTSFGRKPVSRFRAEDVIELADHEAGFRRWTYRREGCFNRERLIVAVKELPPQLLRLKGTCRVAGDASPQLFQMVAQAWSLTPASWEGVQFPDAIILVGVGTSDLPDNRELDAVLDSALAAVSAAS